VSGGASTDGARIAVIIPCYRDGELLPEAIASVSEEESLEVVVVDDASDDEATRLALEQLSTASVTVARHERNLGVAAARNTGLGATRARYVFPLDADDLAASGVLGQMADRLDENPEAEVCFGDYREFGSSELLRQVPGHIDPYRLLYTNEYPVSALYRRTALEAVGGWAALPAYEDWHLWMSLAERGATGVHMGPQTVTYRRRLHGERLLTRAKFNHRRLYLRLRQDHPRLSGDMREHRRRSSLSRRRKLLYPLVYGGRPRFSWEARVKTLLDRSGIWTLRR